ncbi:MAG: hypothetical protein K0M49_08525 [Arenimonas sp.]|nr:hypothetical protein [Rhizobium sp.]MBW8445662.1 hypothetical protein [Arenimonas sp.]
MEKLICGGQYARGLGKRFGAFAVITLAFPFLVYGVIGISGARSVGGASGALALVLGVYLKPIIYLWFAYSTLRISLNRAQTIGISPMIGLCIPLLILADLSFGITFGSFWAVGFSLGIMSTLVPTSLLTGVITVVTLSLLRGIEETMTERMESLYRIWKALLFVSLGLGLVGLFPLLSMWFFGASGMNLSILLTRAISYLRVFLIYPYGLLLAFAAASTALILESRRPSTGGGSGTSTQNQAPLFGSRSL